MMRVRYCRRMALHILTMKRQKGGLQADAAVVAAGPMYLSKTHQLEKH